MPRRSTRRSLAILFVTIGLVVLQASRLFHLLLVSHATCEHGELIELVDRPAQGERHAAADGEDARREHVDLGSAEEQGHDHCDALAVRHGLAGVAPAVGAPCLLTIAPAAALGESAGARPVPVLALAPKSSPPAA